MNKTDAVKEMNIRMKDGNDKTKQALTDLGLNADLMTNSFARGGEEGADAFNEIMIALANVEDPLLKNQMGVAIMGTMYEDLESTVVDSLAEVGNHVDMNADSLDNLNEIKYDTLGEALTGVGRSALIGILEPFQEKVMPIVNSFASFMAENMPKVREVAEQTFTRIFDVAMQVYDYFKENILPVLLGLYETIAQYFPRIKQIVEDVFSGIIIPIFKFLMEVVKEVFPLIQGIITIAFEAVILVAEKVIGIFKGVVDAIKSAFEWLKSWNGADKTDWNDPANYSRADDNWDSNWSAHATGTNYHRGGIALVGERGPELIQLPSGSKVKTANQTNGILSKTSGTTNYITINSPQALSPYETAKEFEKVSRNLAYGLR